MGPRFIKVSAKGVAEVLAYHRGDFQVDPLLPPPMFGGGSATAAGLPFKPTYAEFAAFAKGSDPSSSIQLTPRKLKTPLHKGAHTVPKTLSVLMLRCERALGLLPKTAALIVCEVEEFAWCRIQKKGQRPELYRPAGVAMVFFFHAFSDGQDPHPHPHYGLSGAAFHSERGWRSLWTSPIYENSELIFARVTAGLAVEARKLGYELDPDGDSFRVRGVPRDLASWHSSRTNTIKTLLSDIGGTKDDTLGRQRIAHGTKIGAPKPDTQATIEALREVLPESTNRTLMEIVQNARDTVRAREGLDIELTSVSAAHDKLKTVIAEKQVTPVSTAEIAVLRALPGYATKDTFREAANVLAPAQFSRGRHAYFISGEVLHGKEALPVEVINGAYDARSQCALPRSRAVEYLASGAAQSLIVCEVEEATEFCGSLLARAEAKREGKMRVIDVSSADLTSLVDAIQLPRSADEQLVLVTEPPSRAFCSLATVLTEPTLKGPTLPRLMVTDRAGAECEDAFYPVDSVAREVTEKDLFDVLRKAYRRPNPPLIITQSEALARSINQQLHEDAVRNSPVEAVSWYSRLARPSLASAETAYAYLHHDRPGMSKGSIVSARSKDRGIELVDQASGKKSFLESWEESHACSLFKESKMELAAEEPVFEHEVNSIPESPFAPTRVSGRSMSPASGSGKFWTLGYAATLASLPKEGLGCGIIFVNERHGISGEDQAILRRQFCKAPTPPIIIELHTAPSLQLEVLHREAEPSHHQAPFDDQAQAPVTEAALPEI